MRTIATAAAVLGIAAAVASFGAVRPVAADVTPAPQPSFAVAPGEGQSPPAKGGIGILATSVRARAVATGTIGNPERVDVHGWRADLRVDQVLSGSVSLGDTLTIAWEELSVARRARFQAGERVLVVLQPLPTQSLWRKRFPAADSMTAVSVVASNGEAFLTRPDGVTLDALEHYLAMTPDARNGAPGADRLADLVRGGHSSVAAEALAFLQAEPAHVDLLDEDGVASLLGAARSEEREASLRSGALLLAARRRLPGTRETALALTAPSSPIRADAYRALAALPEGLSAEDAERLLKDPDPALRVVGVEIAAGPNARENLKQLAHGDPAPSVRLAAGRALLARERKSAIPDVIGLLDDTDKGVRSGIAESIGALGDDAVDPLLAVVDGGSERAALAAVLGLSRTGGKGATTLSSIAEKHPKESVRNFARLALGKAGGPAH